jgi:hypothetical protein
VHPMVQFGQKLPVLPPLGNSKTGVNWAYLQPVKRRILSVRGVYILRSQFFWRGVAHTSAGVLSIVGGDQWRLLGSTKRVTHGIFAASASFSATKAKTLRRNSSKFWSFFSVAWVSRLAIMNSNNRSDTFWRAGDSRGSSRFLGLRSRAEIRIPAPEGVLPLLPLRPNPFPGSAAHSTLETHCRATGTT